MNHDTYESKVVNIISSSLPYSTCRRLDANPNEWDDEYFNYFLSVYAQLCDLSQFSYSVIETPMLEAITLHLPSDSKTTLQSDLIHVISLYRLREFFAQINTIKINNCDESKMKFVPPSIFTKISSLDMSLDKTKISMDLTDKLIRLYILADHACYHYKSFMELKDCDYQHKKINNNSTKFTHFHDLITTKPNKSIAQYTADHDVLEKEDKHVDSEYAFDFSKIFVNDSDSE